MGLNEAAIVPSQKRRTELTAFDAERSGEEAPCKLLAPAILGSRREMAAGSMPVAGCRSAGMVTNQESSKKSALTPVTLAALRTVATLLASSWRTGSGTGLESLPMEVAS